MKNLFSSLALCLLTTTAALAQWTTYNTINSPLHSNVVREVAIDTDGSKWIATQHAVQKLSGTIWTTYTAAINGTTSPNVFCVAARNGIVWVGTDKGLSRFDGTTWTTFSNPAQLPTSGPNDLRVADVVIAQNGTVWVAGSMGIARFDGTNWRKFNASNSDLRENAVTSLGLIESGNVLIIGTNCNSNNGGVYTYNYFVDSWGYTRVPGSSCVHGVAITASTIFAGTCNRSGLQASAGNVVSPFTATACVALDGVTLDPSNPRRVWVATETSGAGGTAPKGLLVYDGNAVVQEFNTSNSAIPSNLLSSVELEQTGGQLSAWVGTADQGLAVYQTVVSAQHDAQPRVALAVLPNPATTTVEIQAGLARYTLAVYDNTGRLLRQEQVNQPGPVQLPVQSWPAGLYHVRLTSDHGVGYARFSK